MQDIASAEYHCCCSPGEQLLIFSAAGNITETFSKLVLSFTHLETLTFSHRVSFICIRLSNRDLFSPLLGDDIPTASQRHQCIPLNKVRMNRLAILAKSCTTGFQVQRGLIVGFLQFPATWTSKNVLSVSCASSRTFAPLAFFDALRCIKT
jgi:hypothetical protein